MSAPRDDGAWGFPPVEPVLAAPEPATEPAAEPAREAVAGPADEPAAVPAVSTGAAPRLAGSVPRVVPAAQPAAGDGDGSEDEEPDERVSGPDGRPLRVPADLPGTSPLRVLAGAGLAVGGVVLAVAALLTVTSPPEQALSGQALPVVDAQEPVYDLPAVEAPAVDAPAVEAPAVEAPAVETPAAPAPAPAPASAAAGAPPAADAPAGPPRLPVLVLNNSTVEGLAARAAARFADAGWPVRRTGNFTGRIRATTVYYEPGQQASAERFAATFRGVARVLPRPDFVPGPRGLAVVLTADFPA